MISGARHPATYEHFAEQRKAHVTAGAQTANGKQAGHSCERGLERRRPAGFRPRRRRARRPARPAPSSRQSRAGRARARAPPRRPCGWAPPRRLTRSRRPPRASRGTWRAPRPRTTTAPPAPARLARRRQLLTTLLAGHVACHGGNLCCWFSRDAGPAETQGAPPQPACAVSQGRPQLPQVPTRHPLRPDAPQARCCS